MRNTKCFVYWLTGLMMTLSFPALARELPCGFTCKPQEDLSLECEAKGFSELKRAPEWVISVDGHQVDRARGWRVVLYPDGSKVNTITLRAVVKHEELVMAGTWGKAPSAFPTEQLAAAQP